MSVALRCNDDADINGRAFHHKRYVGMDKCTTQLSRAKCNAEAVLGRAAPDAISLLHCDVRRGIPLAGDSSVICMRVVSRMRLSVVTTCPSVALLIHPCGARWCL